MRDLHGQTAPMDAYVYVEGGQSPYDSLYDNNLHGIPLVIITREDSKVGKIEESKRINNIE
jgi:hypothetical protein